MIREVKGDLWKALTEHERRSNSLIGIAHGVNCQGVMGAGFARDYKRFFPNAFQVYENMCSEKNSHHLMGTVQHVNYVPQLFHVFTQVAFSGASAGAVNAGFHVLRCKAERYVEHLFMPRIGAGLGGLDWDHVVRPMLDYAFDGSKIDVFVFHLEDK